MKLSLLLLSVLLALSASADLRGPEASRRTWILYRPYYNPKPTDPFVPSGVLGPVRLTVR